MAQKDPRVDAYINKSAEFARPVLAHLRSLVHRACPDVEETIKWSMPFFLHKGLLCMMAAFKQHATFGFWKHERITGKTQKQEAMGQFGRITSLKDLPDDGTLIAHIRKAAEFNEAGIKAPARRKTGQTRELLVPDYLEAALKKNKKAGANFEKFSYSHKKEYVDWLTGAKREETRKKRLNSALAWIARGKPQNWKYMNC